MAFKREQDLVAAAISNPVLRELLEPQVWPLLLKEPRGLFGVPDVVFTAVDLDEGRWVCGPTSALEMKLRNWRRALKQAFRYRAFANAAYVVLDAAHARPAIRHLDMFRRFNVGLITIAVSGAVQVHLSPVHDEPVCQRMADRLSQVVTTHIETC